MRADSVLRAAQGSWFTAAVARIEYRGRPVFERAYGVTRLDDGGRPVFVDTAFDLASITKIFVGTLALAAVRDGVLALDAPLSPWFPEWRDGAYARVTLRMLLSHTSGMNSGADYRQLLGADVVRYTLAREPVARAGERVIYSDLGFIALGELLRRCRGESLARHLARVIPAQVNAAYRVRDRSAIPATEADDWRGRVQGVVHDEKAYLMGGVAGHAGIFGDAASVGWLAEQYLGALHARPSMLPRALVDEALHEQGRDDVLRRGLAWALKTRDDNSCGRWMSRSSFGHTGFVGTCVWADPQRDCSGVLLTNGVYFGRRDTRELRVAFYEAAIEDLGLQ